MTRRELVARQPRTVGRALAAHLAIRCEPLPHVLRAGAHRGRSRGHQSDQELQLVLQHRELGGPSGRVTGARTDIWRAAMIAAVKRKVLPTGVPEALFEVRPTSATPRTSPSRHQRSANRSIGHHCATATSTLAGARRKFLVVSSDVIYLVARARLRVQFHTRSKALRSRSMRFQQSRSGSARSTAAANLMEPMATERRWTLRQLTAVITPRSTRCR